jgi:hypothetical protein
MTRLPRRPTGAVDPGPRNGCTSVGSSNAAGWFSGSRRRRTRGGSPTAPACAACRALPRPCRRHRRRRRSPAPSPPSPPLGRPCCRQRRRRRLQPPSPPTDEALPRRTTPPLKGASTGPRCLPRWTLPLAIRREASSRAETLAGVTRAAARSASVGRSSPCTALRGRWCGPSARPGSGGSGRMTIAVAMTTAVGGSCCTWSISARVQATPPSPWRGCCGPSAASCCWT